ncbi:MAG TPA: hypothetical protein VKY73_14255 [Polyangiaceae bacterium]|nr:hypothetical protein [Polyangiaceae bacterium]
MEPSHAGARVESHGTRISRLYGAELAIGNTPAAAAERFRAEHATALGLPAAELVPQVLRDGAAVAASTPSPLGLMWNPKTKTYKFWLYRYGQVKDGLPVHGSTLLVLVRNGGTNPVVWASSSVRNLGRFRVPATVRSVTVDRAKSLRALPGVTDFAGRPLGTPTSITSVSTPKLVVFAGTEKADAPPRLAMEYVVETAGPPGKFRLIADAQTADVLDAESLIVFADVTGTVAGNRTEGAKSIECSPESAQAFPYAEVTSPSNATLTDADGAFTLPNAGTTAVNVSSPVAGQYFDVFNFLGTNEVLTESVLPPGPVSFLHNAANTDPTVIAQSNGYVHSNEIRDFLLGYVPDYPTIATQTNFRVHVNRTDFLCPGNAWYDSSVPSINFCTASSTHGNTAFASVTHHEFGHHIVQSGGSGQGAYGEGMSDVVAALFAGDPGLGYGFFLNQCSTPLRSADNDCQYSPTACSSCGSESHACGNLISGAIWSVREELALTEPETYVDLVNSLVLSSIPMHIGSGIGPEIAVDLLTLDDDDGNLDNGSPHYDAICAGFGAHGIECPPLLTGLSVAPKAELVSEGPSGGPFAPPSVSYTVTNLGPTPSLAYQVTPTSATPWLSITNGSGSLSTGQQAEVTVAIDQAVAASLPNGGYEASVEFANLTNGVGSTTRTVRLVVGVPTPIFTETFEGGLGSFTLGSESTNLWHVTSACAAAQPGHSSPNALYFGLDTSCTFATGGASAGTVTSTPIAIQDASVVKLRFNYFLGTEQGSPWDRATAQVSVNGGAFTVVASNNTGGVKLEDGTGIWQAAEVDLTPHLEGLASASIRLRFGFDTGDGVANGYPGFLVDDVEVRAFSGGCEDDDDCDDGAFCNGIETCVEGSCAPGTPVACDDGVSCTQDVCDEAADACVAGPDDSACSDGNACNGAELCDAETGCQAGTPLDCDDSNACTVDACDAELGCTHTPVSCDDGNACTVDSCDPVSGCQHTTATCDDGNACTDDSCDPASGCQYTNNTDPCADDGNACTNDVCSGGVCTHPDNGSCNALPCDGICENPQSFSGPLQSGNLGTGERCLQTTGPLNGGNCGNFVSPRQLFVNGVPMTCNYQNWPTIPPQRNGGYCISTTAGNHPWAYVATW